MRVSASDHVYAETIDDETVLLELESGEYYGLDAVGTRLWQLLSELGSTEAVAAAALEEFDVAPTELANDLTRLVHELVQRRLLVVHASTTNASA